MGERVIHVMTHDSIGLGEDGPTHQPVEHLAALRAIPNLLVFRPCDAVETVECWQLALETHRPPERARADAPEPAAAAASASTTHNRCAAGAYEIAPAEDDRPQVSLFATGSEVAIAVEARRLLREARRAGARRLGAVLRAVRRAGRRSSGRRSSAPRRSRSRSRPRSARAGTRSSAPTAPSSA